ncbi:hypothetical protein CTheo_5037 [Ceratobasidium theobromae]|uniref:ubiquitinyl hydrolase 1 n=1 Tax=Ceratobasidium theobromae TaxID=1582974 RepID=A0A5N5QIG0_9AGAM|nr:hypothetical protein CTheo_5037 [Ceratobasidium theobromae]
MISIAMQMALEPDTYWFVISRKWFRAWEAAVLSKPSKEFPTVTEETLGPVDNSDILRLETSGILPDLVEGYDAEFVPEDAWNNFVMWYGQPVGELKRRVIAYPTATGMLETRIEVHPPTFHAFVLSHNPTSIRHVTFKISSHSPISVLAAQAAALLGVPNTKKYRVWNMPPKTPNSGITVGSVIRNTLLPIPLDSDAPLTELNRLSRVLGVEVYSDDQWLLDAESVSIPIDPSSAVNFEGADVEPRPGVPFSGRPAGMPVPRGTMGLKNLGHTCFMNAGLQCLLHIPELEQYFLQNLHRRELNPKNLLSKQGQFAIAFGILVQQVYPAAAKLSLTRVSGRYSSYVPLDFKGVVCRWVPTFAGYEECDSQELVGAVLDGLHEDLNRVLKKPYVEKPEWPEDSQGLSLTEIESRIAHETWVGHARRNDSIIADLFQGMYKSTLSCPECHKVSVTFDPFMSLSLPLPAPTWRHSVYFVPWDVQQQSVALRIHLPSDSTCKTLKKDLASKLNVNPKKHKFFRFFEDHVNITEVVGDEIIVAYELPVRATIFKSETAASDQFEHPLIIPVFHMCSNSTFGIPYLVVANSLNSESYQGTKSLVAERYKQYVQPNGVPNDSFELRIFSSNCNTMETGFRIDSPGASFVDWGTREHQFEGKPPIRPTEALVCVWHRDSWEQFFPHQSMFNSWEARLASEAKEMPKTRREEIYIADCLDELTKTERLGINDSWYCSRCQMHRQATKQIQLWKLPNILVLQLKRFAKRAKIDKMIKFPIHGLDLSERVGEPTSAGECVYDLFAVDDHKGDRMSTGHYTTFAKNESDGGWYHYQDAVVTPVSPESIVTPGAYVLFYRRRTASVQDILSKVGTRPDALK